MTPIRRPVTGNATPAVSRRLRWCLLAGLLGLAVALNPLLPLDTQAQVQQPGAPAFLPGAQVQRPGAPAYPPAAAQVQQPAAQVQQPVAPLAAGPSSPLDEPVRLVAEARQMYQKVHDYTCTMIKQERVNGQLQPENIIAVKLRNQPFSVYMRWSAPRESAGQEVCFVHGRNNNQMRVHANGILGVAGFVSIDPRDPKVMQNSRHTIYEAGLGNTIERMARAWDEERRAGKTQARIAEYEYAKRRCVRVETYYTERVPQAYCWRSVVYFDKENKLPIRTEAYDWPRAGVPGGDLLESFSHIDLRFNVGLTDAAFNY
jgi:hypothetical protein